MKVHVFIPHYFRELEAGSSYGSGRLGSRTARSIALGRCLSALLNLRQPAMDLELNIGLRTVDELPPATAESTTTATEVEITVCKSGDHYLKEVTDLFRNQIRVLNVELEDPKQLALATRNHLIHSKEQSDLSIYLEDDLVINDPHYLEKLAWFHQKTNHKTCLMPHRYERIDSGSDGILLVDGPLKPAFISRFAQPKKNVASGKYLGSEEVSFDIADNPHSGTFCVSSEQIQFLQRQNLPTQGFVGPLETAATLTVLQFFPVLKPSRNHRGFLLIEHGHPSFRSYTNKFPRRQP